MPAGSPSSVHDAHQARPAVGPDLAQPRALRPIRGPLRRRTALRVTPRRCTRPPTSKSLQHGASHANLTKRCDHPRSRTSRRPSPCTHRYPAGTVTLRQRRSPRQRASAPCGLFVCGTDTGVGKTYVAALIACTLHKQGVRVGVYKPAASGVTRAEVIRRRDDATRLWLAAGCPGTVARVCPQQFRAPLAPYLAAAAEGRQVDPALLRAGLRWWQQRSSLVLVEGAGGLLSPITQQELVADLAREFGYPLVVVAANRVGAIHQVLATLCAAREHCPEVPVAGVVLNQPDATPDAASAHNPAELARLTAVPVLALLKHRARCFEPPVDWLALARKASCGKGSRLVRSARKDAPQAAPDAP